MAVVESSGYAHIRLTVTDIARSKAFYDEVFGFRVPLAIHGVEVKLLDPRSTWRDPEAGSDLVTFALNADGKIDHLTWPGQGDFARVAADSTK